VSWYLEGQKRFGSQVKKPTAPGEEAVIRFDLGEGQDVVVRYTPNPWGYTESPAGSGLYMPSSFTCEVVLHELPYTVKMAIGVSEGAAPNLNSLTVSRRGTIAVGGADEIREYPGPKSIKSEALRDVPVGRVFRLALLAAVHHAPSVDGVPTVLERESEVAESYRRAARGMLSPRSAIRAGDGREVPMDDNFYREVAAVFQAATTAGDFPVQAVKDEWAMSIATANRYVKEARKRGFLDPPDKKRES
jgi:hypothetical protein